MKKLLLITFASFIGSLQLNICASAATASTSTAASATASETKSTKEQLTESMEQFDYQFKNMLKEFTSSSKKLNTEKDQDLLDTLSRLMFSIAGAIKFDITKNLSLIYSDLKAEIESLKKSSAK